MHIPNIHYYSKKEEIPGHIQKYHQQSSLTSYIKEIVYGGSDGVVTTLAVISGFAGSTQENSVIPLTAVLLFGFANLLADASSMGLSNFLSSRSEQKMSQNQLLKQKTEIETSPQKALQETKILLESDGFKSQQIEVLAPLLASNPNFWQKYMLQKETGLVVEENSNNLWGSVFTALSFIFFGFFPLLPYLLNIPNNTYPASLLLALAGLVVLGSLRYYATKEQWLRAVFETVLVSAVSSGIAFLVGSLFK